MDKILFYPNDNIILMDLIDNFLQFIDENINCVYDEDGVNHEFEITLYRPDIIKTMSRIYQLIDNDKFKKCYIERVINKKDLKYRSRINLSDLGTSKIKNVNVSKKDSSIWEEKKLVNKKVVEIENFIYDIKYSVEKQNIKLFTSNYLSDQNSISLWVVNSLTIVYMDVKLSMKQKGILGSGSDTNSNYMKYITNFSKIPNNTSWYIELEYNGKVKDYNKEKFRKNLIDCFSLIYGVSNINNIAVLKFKTPTLLKTNFITFKELINKNEEGILITQKIDGEMVEFKVKDGLCYMIIDNIIYVLETKFKKSIRITGVGEYVKKGNFRTIFPFYIYSLNKRILKNRQKSLLKLQAILEENNDFKNFSDRVDEIEVDSNSYNAKKYSNLPSIDFAFKDFKGPFDSKEEMMMCVYDFLTKQNNNYDIDGIIIMNKDNNNFPIDEKFKLDNTVDVLAHIKPNLILKSDGIYIEMDLIKFSNTEELFRKVYIKNNDDFHLDNKLSVVVIKSAEEHQKYLICPLCLIYEYSLLYNKIIKPRFIKTNKFFYQKYMGNSYTVITKSEDVHTMNKIPPIETFRELGKKFDLSKIYNLADTTEEYLNKEKTKYFIENNTKRVSLNYITNFVKTQAILNSFSPILKEIKFDKKNNNYLSIDVGRGGDLQRYFYINANTLIGSDPSENALDECRNRYEQRIKKSRSTLFKLNLLRMYFNDKDYVSRVTLHGVNQFEGIDWNMAIHYSWKHNKKIEIVKKIHMLLKEHGKIVITTLDGEKVRNEFNKLSSDEIDFNIDGIKIKFVLDKDAEGNEINKVYIPTMTSESQDEYLIDILDMIKIFESNKFLLLDYYHFDFIEEFQDMFDTLSVIRNEKEDSRYYFFRNLTNSKIKKGSDLDRICSLYVSLIFQKI